MQALQSVSNWLFESMKYIFNFISTGAGIIGMMLIARFLLTHVYKFIKKFL